MKKQFSLLLAVLLISMGSLFAQQPGGGQRQTPEERTKSTMEKLTPLALNADQTTKTTAVFSEVYTQQQKVMEEMRANGNMDREAMMAKRKEMNDARDLKLKEIFTADQYKKFKDEIEPTMMPQRRPAN